MSTLTLVPDLTPSIHDHLDPQCQLRHDPQPHHPPPETSHYQPTIHQLLEQLDYRLSTLADRTAQLEDYLLPDRTW